MDPHKQELDALQRWIFGTAGLSSKRMAAVTDVSKLPRPVVLWETPYRRGSRALTQYQYVVPVVQYGRLYVKDHDDLTVLAGKLETDIHEKAGVLPIYDKEGPGAVQIGTLKNVEIEVAGGEGLDVPIRIRYEVTYGRTRPAAPPPADTIGTKVVAH